MWPVVLDGHHLIGHGIVENCSQSVEGKAYDANNGCVREPG